MISIIHPSRSRPEQAYTTFRNWFEKSDDWNNIEYFLAVDSDQEKIYSDVVKNLAEKPKVRALPNKSAIEAINNTAKLTIGDILVIVSDDFNCPEHWDTLLLEYLHPGNIHDFCAKTDDGLQPTLITMPIMDRVYYERYGYIYHPDYLHMHADEELTCVALMMGKYIKIPLLFAHNHYTTGRTQKDEINVKNDSTWGQGQRTLDRHAKNNFGIENPVMRREDIKWR